ncbi:MAG: zinc-dependent metalloprotease [Verrucomicrobiota bacterium]
MGPQKNLPLLALSFVLSSQLVAQEPQPDPSEQPSPKPPVPVAKLAALTATASNHISVPKASFGKEFLISASVIPQVVSPTSTALAGKVVRFELFPDGVDLYESTSGLVVTDELPSRRLLTTFPIVSEDAQNVVIDFNAGMRRVFNEVWHTAGGRFNSSAGTRSLEITLSRIFEVKTLGDELIVRQSVQARDRQMDPNREDRYEMRYFISPYVPGDLKTKENDLRAARYVRFFETHALLEPKTGRSTSKITLFDIRKPVVIHYSANTPADYEDAVRDGILYWNRAFGKEVIQVEKAPEGVTAPDARYNIVQWVPWDTAGFAYADLLVDPKTGQSLHGQAYIHSAFAVVGRARVRSQLRAMRVAGEGKLNAYRQSQSESGHREDGHGLSLSKDGERGGGILSPAHSCDLDPGEFARSFAVGLEAILSEESLDENSTKRISQDYVRAVIAHEVGHILGLRHNFAGSLECTMTRKELDDWFKAYTKDDQTPVSEERVSTSSIMEYTGLKASVYAGAQIRKTKGALPHDRATIRWGYLDDTEAMDKKLLFGTDQDATVYGDVLPGDYGVEPVLSAYGSIGELLRTLPNSLIETFISAKAPEDVRDRRPLEMVDLRTDQYVARLSVELTRMLSWFKAGTRSLRVEKAFSFTGELNEKELLQAHWKALNEQVERLGGVDRAVFGFLPVDLKLDLKTEPKEVESVERLDAQKMTERLSKLLESPNYETFVGLDDKTHSFTKEEKALILERGKKFFEEFEKRVLKAACQTFENTRRDLGVRASESVGEDDIVAKLERRFQEFSKELILKRNEEQRRRGKVDKAYVEVADFKYDLETRLAAARVLSDNNGSFKGWAVEAKADLHKQLKEAVEGSLNIQNFKDFQESILSRPLRDWFLNQQSVLALLPAKKMGPPAPMPNTSGAPH